MKYRVCITETLEEVVEVDAESSDEAVRKVHESEQVAATHAGLSNLKTTDW